MIVYEHTEDFCLREALYKVKRWGPDIHLNHDGLTELAKSYQNALNHLKVRWH